jgi:branched-chain amino acid transport system permease protein/neutral amino acid transport system permease protein
VVLSLVGFLILLIFVGQAKHVTFARLASLTVWGLIFGAIIALGAIGLSLVYGILRFANFAHGDLMTVGAYIALLFVSTVFPQGSRLAPFSFGWEFLAALPLAMIGTVLVALVLERLIFAPLRRHGSSPVILAMAALGAAFLVRSLVYIIWGADFHFYYGGIRQMLTLPFGIRIRYDQLIILGMALLFVAFIYVFLERTKLGKAMRATADNPELARVTGIDVGRVIFWTWALGTAMAAVGGVLLGLDSQVRPEMGWLVLLPLFAAVILGGIGNPYGALVGGLIIGVIQQVSTAFLNPAYKPAVAFVVMIIILLVRPQGIFGGKER